MFLKSRFRYFLCDFVHCAGDVGEAFNSLTQSSKIIESDVVPDDFMDGKETTRVIVTLSEPATAPQSTDFRNLAFRNELRGAVQAAQEQAIRSLDPDKVQITNRFVYIFGFSAEVTLEGLGELEELDEVATITKDRILEAHLAQGIPLMNASTVRTTYNGSGMAIAICDTGIDYTHPRLGGGGFPNSKVIGGRDVGDDDDDPMDANGHGTCCAGIAAGDLGTMGDYIGGVAYNARLYAVKISFGSGGSAFTSDMIEGWEWCITHQDDDPANPIMVISTSFGGGYYTSNCDSDVPVMTTAAANCVAAGMTLFVSSGNDGFCDGMGWPACITHVNAVGAVYDDDIGRYPPTGFVGCISNYSCTGNPAPPCLEKWYVDDPTYGDLVTTYSNTATFLHLFAPSNNAYTTDIVGASGYDPGSYYSAFGGTSAACPYAAGAAACLQSAALSINGTFLTPAEVQSTLTSTGDSVTDPKVPSINKPRINLGAAVYCLQMGDELAVDFGGNGLWHYDGSSWTQLNGQDPEDMEEWAGGLAADFGATGLWNYDGSSWSLLTTNNAEGMKVWTNGLAVDFGAIGLWNYDGSSWSLLTTNNAEGMEAWANGIAADFGSIGLWNYDGSSWGLLTTSNAEGMEAWDNGLAVDFGSFGLWNNDGTSWSLLTTNNAEAMEAWAEGLAADFGGFGLWNYDGSSWSLLTTNDAELMATWCNGLAVDFGSFGMWSYSDSSWGLLTTSNAEDMEGWNSALAVDLGTRGLWNYDGSVWSLLITWDAEDTIDMNLN